jgi:hypothetical protein
MRSWRRVTELRDLRDEPDPDSTHWRPWADEKKKLLNCILTQTLLIPMPDLRIRLRFATETLSRSGDLENLSGFSERGSMQVLCAEALDCLGAYFRGEPLPLRARPQRERELRSKKR